jgi:hypothetical protein
MCIVSKGEVCAYAVLDVRQKSGTPACCGGVEEPARCRIFVYPQAPRHTARLALEEQPVVVTKLFNDEPAPPSGQGAAKGGGPV